MSTTLPMLTLNRDYIMNTTKGHSVGFKKGVPTFVPAIIYQEALSIGAQAPDGTELDVLNTQKPGAAPLDPSERAPLILMAIESLVETNNRKDFTAAGSPAVKAVERELGFDVDGREVAAAWQLYHDKKAGM